MPKSIITPLLLIVQLLHHPQYSTCFLNLHIQSNVRERTGIIAKSSSLHHLRMSYRQRPNKGSTFVSNVKKKNNNNTRKKKRKKRRVRFSSYSRFSNDTKTYQLTNEQQREKEENDSIKVINVNGASDNEATFDDNDKMKTNGIDMNTTTTKKKKTKFSTYPSFAYDTSSFGKAKEEDMDMWNNFMETLFGEEKTWLEKRMIESRSYSNADSFSNANAKKPPILGDVFPRHMRPHEELWNKPLFRTIMIIVSFFSFPTLAAFFNELIQISPMDMKEIAKTFNPGMGILYATFTSMTLNILYQRKKILQLLASEESAVLSLTARNFIEIFRDDEESSIDACQAVADQIKIMARGSRAKEIVGLMYSDPYGKMLDLVAMEERRSKHHGPLLDSLRARVEQLTMIRSKRLSEEALALQPYHFSLLLRLTSLILLAFILANLDTLQKSESPLEAAVIFSILFTMYLQFYFFANDLNNPFKGVYQVRTGSIACHLLQAKWLIGNQPYGEEIDFDTVTDEDLGQEYFIINSPGIGKVVINKNNSS